MSSIIVGTTSLLRTGMTAVVDAIASTGAKAIIAPLEDKTKSSEFLAKQCIMDEGPETFWKAIFGSILAKLNKSYAPYIPEQLVNIPGDLLGAYLHWKSAAHQSLDTILTRTVKAKSNGNLLDKFFDNCIKTPTNNLLKFIGFNSQEHQLSFARFGISNIIVFLLATLGLKGSEDDNIPGVNLDHNEPVSTSIFKTIGYTAIEQITHIGSQWMRYYQNYKNEFGKDFHLAKSIANAVNEKTFPGNILSGIGACLSTLWLGRYLPKSAAGAIGEIIPKAFTRLLEVRLRRSTKDKFDETSENKRTVNHRIKDIKWLDKSLDVIDHPFAALRKLTIDHIIVPVFKPSNLTYEEFKKEIYNSFDLSLEALKLKNKNINGNGLAVTT